MTRKYFIVFLSVILIALLFWGSAMLQNFFDDLVLVFQNYVQENYFLSMSIFLVLSVVSVLFFAFSSIWLIPIAIPIWGSFVTLILLLSGWLLGSVFSYGIGRFAGPPIVRYFISPEKADYYTQRLLNSERAFSFVLFSRFILPSELLGYALGAARYHFGKYFLVTFLSEVPYALIAVYAIDAILKKDPLFFGLWMAVWSLLVIFFVWMLKKKLFNLNISRT